MATLRVRNLEDDVVRRLRMRAAAHGHSAEAEHREILRAVLTADNQLAARREAAERLAAFRERVGGSGIPSAMELLAVSRCARMQSLTGRGERV